MRTDMRNDRKKNAVMITVVTLATILEATVLAAFAWWQIDNYERGIAELYAQEQDGYVEIVARQIERYGDIAGDDFVEDTIDLLDSTSHRYWTLDDSEGFLFVKSVNETNVYKSFSTETFYNTVSSQEFITNLKIGQVTHMIITLDDYEYIASGVIFEYRGTEYRLCLLTDYDVMLTNNEYLSSKLYLIIDFMLMIALLSISIIYFIIRLQRANAEVDKEVEIKHKLNRYVEFLNSVVMGRNGTLIIAGKGQILRLFHRLDERNDYPMGFVVIKPGSEQMMDIYEEGRKALGDSVVWVRSGKDRYILLLGNMTGEQASEFIRNRYKETAKIITGTYTASWDKSCMEVYSDILRSEGEDL